MDDSTPNDTAARLLALEAQVEHLERMVRRLTEAVLDTAQASGYRLKHVKLARTGLQLGYIRPDDWV